MAENQRQLVPWQPNPRSVHLALQRYCSILGHGDHIIWDRYGVNDRSQLKLKIKLLFNCADDQAVDLANSSKEDKKKYEETEIMIDGIVEACWNQRKYCCGILLMAPVFVAIVPCATFQAQRYESSDYQLLPVLRMARCFRRGASSSHANSEGCCMVFVDHNARVYQHWADFLANNMYGDAHVLVAPSNGVFTTGVGDRVRLTDSVQHHSSFRAIETPMTIASVASTAVAIGACVAAMPAVLMTGAVATGVGISVIGVGRSIATLRDRRNHEQSTSITADREARSAWLNVAGSSLGLAASAALSGVKAAARTGQSLSWTRGIFTNGLQSASILTNGISVVNGIACIYQDDNWSRQNITQISCSMFLLTHSIYNFRTAGLVFEDAQRTAIQSYSDALSKNQQRAFSKMMKETLRNNPTSGRSDVIRGMQTIGDNKGFFRDVHKMKASLNRNKVRVSFDKSGRPVLNNEAPFDSAQLRADLRSAPATKVFAKVPAEPPSSGGLRSSSRQATQSVNAFMNQQRPAGTNMPINLQRPFECPTNYAREYWPLVYKIALAFFREFSDTITNEWHMNFDTHFTEQVYDFLILLAEKAKEKFRVYIQTTARSVLHKALSDMFELAASSQFVELSESALDSLLDEFIVSAGYLLEHVNDMNSYVQRLRELLVDIGEEALRRVLDIAGISFGHVLELGATIDFENYFWSDVIEMLMNMCRKSKNSDFTMYVLGMELEDLQQYHKDVNDHYNRMRERVNTAKQCDVCKGCFSLVEL